MSELEDVTAWRVRGSYFEGCNCEAICPCRSVHGQPGGPSTYGICYGAVSWHVHDGHAGLVDLSDRMVVLSIRYRDDVQPSTPWEVVLYVDDRADDTQRDALADIFLGRAGGTVADLYGPAIGEVHAIRSARITLEHVAPRKAHRCRRLPHHRSRRCSVGGRRRSLRHPRLRSPGHRVVCRRAEFDRRGAPLGDTWRAQRPRLPQTSTTAQLHDRLLMLWI